MAVIASIFVALAALLHVYIFLMESVWWTRPATWRRFGVADQASADTIRPMAYNQGFYNLFLGLGAALGLVLYWTGVALPGGRSWSSRPRAWCWRRWCSSPPGADTCERR
jgi:putative membrane protein